MKMLIHIILHDDTDVAIIGFKVYTRETMAIAVVDVLHPNILQE